MTSHTLPDRTISALTAGGVAFMAALGLLLARGDSVAGPGDPAPRPAISAEDEARTAAAHLQRVTETGEARFYALAESAIERGLAKDPSSGVVLTEAAALAASRHDFPAAERLARRAATAEPDLVSSSAVLVDALVQQGKVAQAGRELQSLLDRKPSAGAYARASYLRQVDGDLGGARAAMRLAISASGESTRAAAALQEHLAEIELLAGRPRAVRRVYAGVLARFPDRTGPQLGIAQIDVARGRVDAGAARLERLVALDGPADVDAWIALGEIRLAQGRRAGAKRLLARVGPARRVLAAHGARTDGEFAEFVADHGDASSALAMARRAHAAREGLHTTDALGWALTRAGRPAEALPLARRALAIDPTDPHTRYHAGMAAAGAGRTSLARRLLRGALARPEILGPWHARRAQRTMKGLSG
jgi:tetratricopeptide (TPR) repeat protein